MDVKELCARILAETGRIIIGKDEVVRLVVMAALAGKSQKPDKFSPMSAESFGNRRDSDQDKSAQVQDESINSAPYSSRECL